MPLYELGVIIDPEIPPEEETTALERLEKIITEADGTVLDKDAWGRRQLAYPSRRRPTASTISGNSSPTGRS